MSKHSVLVIDDEPQIRKLLEITLESNEYQVHLASTAKEGLIAAATHPPDLILLDLGLPDKSGHEVLTELRAWFNHAIVVLSVINDETDVVRALDNGASDYLFKPFRTAELMARIRAAIKRNDTAGNEQRIVVGDLALDLVARTLSKNNLVIKLTATEYNLMQLLAKNHGRVLTHQYLLKTIWGLTYQDETQYLRVFIGTLRKKIEDNPNAPQHIITESGVGYRLL